MPRRTLLASLALALLCAASAPACDNCGGGYGLGMGYMYGALDYRVPYFAAHPPVYYSAPVPRSYGHSPFAYPPHFRTPEIVEAVKPVEIVNPYVPSSATKSETPAEGRVTKKATTPQPLIVENPYVKQKSQVMNASHEI